MSLQFDLKKFQGLFPHATVTSGYLEYQVEDSNYRVYNPKWNGNQTELSLIIDHIRGGATDDHANLLLAFNADGSLQQASGDWQAGNDGYQIPPLVIAAVDGAAAVFAVSTGPETLGVSVVATVAATAAFDIFCVLFNQMVPHLISLDDDGGRLYTLPVACHAVNRACSCVSA